MARAEAPVAVLALSLLAAAQLVLWFASSGPLAYGYMSDEMYYLDCAERLAWGYVDHPPLSLAILAAVRALLGESLFALHLVPALAACLNIGLVALLARELGGGRIAQGVAAVATFSAPVYLGVASFYSMNAFEPALWSGAALLLARIGNGGNPRLWLVLGAALGLGLLNKLSVLWLGMGLATGLVFTPARRWLATPWPWACGAIAGLLLSPHLIWQVANDWPTLEFIGNATEHKLVSKTPLAFALEQILVMGPLAAPLWFAGLLFYFRAEAGRRHQLLAWIWIAVIALLIASGSTRSNYSGPAYGSLLAAGGVAVEEFSRRGLRRLLPAALAFGLLVTGLLGAPMAMPLLPPDQLIAYSRTIGVDVPRDQVGDSGPLPIHFALRFGWEALVDAVVQARDTLTPEERARAVVLAPSFGASGALHFVGRDRGLPPVISGHNNYFLWGPGDTDGEVVIAIADDSSALEEAYRSVERVAEIDCAYCDPEVDRWSVFVCRGLRIPFAEFWRSSKHFI